MATTKLNVDHLLLLEQATLKAPVDTLRKIQKTSQRTFEHNLGPTSVFQKDLSSLASLASKTSSTTPLPPSTQSDMLKTVDGMLSRMRGLKRKLSEVQSQADAANHVTKARMEYLRSIPETTDDKEYDGWASKRLANHLADYFLRASPQLKKSAKELAKEKGVEELVDFEVWDELAKAENGLREKRLDEVLAWVGENKVALRKMKSSLEFTIHLQGYIELCRSRSAQQAIAYAKKHLSPSAAQDIGGTQMEELNRAMALLAFPPDTTCKVYQELYSPSRWTSLLTLFRTTFLSLHSLPSLSLLSLSLQAGLASLKTPLCIPLSPSSTSKPSPECPICSSPLKSLAPEVPYSHHVNSTIVCAISGKVVEGGAGEGGGLVAIISRVTGEGRVYSKEALWEQAKIHPQNKLVDPSSGEVFEWEDLKKVFIS